MSILQRIKISINEHLLNPILSLVYPEMCVFCGGQPDVGSDERTEKDICPDCLEGLHFQPRFNRGVGIYGESFSGLMSLGYHIGLLRDGIIDLKFRKRFLPLNVIWRIYLRSEGYFHNEMRDCDVILPVPLHWTRRLRRGFNQAKEIGNYLSDAVSIPLVSNYLVRTKRTRSMPGLTRTERVENVRDAFGVVGVRGRFKSVILVDDVMTTGATLSSCARVLRSAGVENIYAFVITRQFI